MTNNKIIAVDMGSLATKVKYGVKEADSFIFNSLCSPATEIDELVDSSYLIEDGNKFIIGTKGAYQFSKEKHNKENYTKLLKYAIGKSLKQKESTINLVIGIPLIQHTKRYLDELKKVIKSINNFEVCVDGKNRAVTIDNFIIRPESYGLYQMIKSNEHINKSAKTMIIDIGGTTTDISVFSTSGDFLSDESTSLEIGAINYYQKVKALVYEMDGINLTLNEVKDFCDTELKISGVNFRPNGVTLGSIDAGRQIIFNELFNSILSITTDIKQYNIVVTGGNGVTFYNNFQKLINGVILFNNINCNVEAYYRMGVSKWHINK